MRHFHSKTFHLSWVIAIILAGIALFYIERHYTVTIEELPINFNHTISESLPEKKSANSKTQTPNTQNLIPNTLLLPVPFTPQAPTANWDTLHNEACEEASAIMAYAYYAGMKDLTLKPSFVEEEIVKITEWETNSFGYFLDINSEETVKLLKEFYGLQARILENYTQGDLKKILSQNQLILLPANGRLLGNPNFRSPGPPYHMLVIKGYNSLGFITNDPGTRKGLNYPYSFDTLLKANGDFNHQTHEVNLSKKTAIVVWK